MEDTDLKDLQTDVNFSPSSYWDRRFSKFGVCGGGSVTEEELKEPEREVNRLSRAYLKPILKHFPTKFTNCLYLGCGAGRMLPILFEFTKRIIASDISIEALKILSKDYSWLVNNILEVYHSNESNQHLQIKTASVDLIFVNSLFLHVREPDASNIVKEFSRILEIGGCIVAIEPTWSEERLESIDVKDIRSHMSYRTKDDFLKLFSSFSDIENVKEHLYIIRKR